MYHKAYGIIETLAPLHVGASAGEETGNLNLIFRDQFTQTGIIPGSSIRGRFRADMRTSEKGLENLWYGQEAVEEEQTEADEGAANQIETLSAESGSQSPNAAKKRKDTTEALVKFEYASVVWLPVFCPGQPIVWVSCPRLLKRYQQITGIEGNIPKPQGNPKQHPVKLNEHRDRLFFNLGFLDNLKDTPELEKHWVPKGTNVQPDSLVVVDDADISLIHDMALYRQTRTKLEDDVKKVKNFFGFEALPEDSILIFPIAIKKALPLSAKESLAKLKYPEQWEPFATNKDGKVHLDRSLYFGGLESIGCGRCRVTLAGEYFAEAIGKEGSV